jgi:hypothetical protein
MPLRKLPVAVLILCSSCFGAGTTEQAASADAGSTHNVSGLEEPASAALPLDSLDWVVAGIDAGADAAHVLSLLGPPDSVVHHSHPYDADAWLARWDYPDFTVHFVDEFTVSGVQLSGPSVRTRRGVQVGDEIGRVRLLYGPPRDTTWTSPAGADT